MNNSTRTWIILLSLLFAFGAYHMPWTTHDVAAFSNNAFDLAEFMSLHPAVQNESPPLTTSFNLRVPIILLSLMIVLSASQLESEKMRWLWRGVGLLLVLRLNPPQEFYPFGGGSENDQQLGELMFIGLGTCIAVIVLSRVLRPAYPILMVTSLVLATVSANSGLDSSLGIIESLALKVEVGGGFYLYLGALALGGVLFLQLIATRALAYWRKQKEQAKKSPVLLS